MNEIEMIVTGAAMATSMFLLYSAVTVALDHIILAILCAVMGLFVGYVSLVWARIIK